MKTFSQIAAEGIGSTNKPEYVIVKAMCTSIKKDTVVYQVKEMNSIYSFLFLSHYLRCVHKIDAVRN